MNIERSEFEMQMHVIKEIMDRKGFVVESDHRYAYYMQDDGFFFEVKEWLHDNGYEERPINMGLYDDDVAYGLFDVEQFKVDEIENILR